MWSDIEKLNLKPQYFEIVFHSTQFNLVPKELDGFLAVEMGDKKIYDIPVDLTVGKIWVEDLLRERVYFGLCYRTSGSGVIVHGDDGKVMNSYKRGGFEFYVKKKMFLALIKDGYVYLTGWEMDTSVPSKMKNIIYAKVLTGTNALKIISSWFYFSETST